jgi:hypothetical protein
MNDKQAGPDTGRPRSTWFRLAPPSLQEGKMGYILLWLLGIPIPILLLIYLLRGCT